MTEEEWAPGEVRRSFDRIEKALEKLGRSFVSVELYAADKAAGAERETVANQKIAKLEKDAEYAEKAQREAEKAVEEQKNRNRLFLYGIIASPLVAIIVGWVSAGGLNR